MAHVYCGQTAGWIKVPFGTEIGLGPGYIALDGDPAPTPKKEHSSPPIFDPFLLWQNGWMIKMPLGRKVGHRPWPHCVRREPSSSSLKGAQPPTRNFRPMSIVAKRSPISATAEHLFVTSHFQLNFSSFKFFRGSDRVSVTVYG